jgi:hypothetical protein
MYAWSYKDSEKHCFFVVCEVIPIENLRSANCGPQNPQFSPCQKTALAPGILHRMNVKILNLQNSRSPQLTIISLCLKSFDEQTLVLGAQEDYEALASYCL